eukprot:NODE_14_length_42432_cov_0.433799.p5 type:complete len:608 gc:universal NODE_14_length_42432_cov_0.433799:32186-34009(+)
MFYAIRDLTRSLVDYPHIVTISFQLFFTCCSTIFVTSTMSPLDLIKTRIAQHLIKLYPSTSESAIIELLEEPKHALHGDLSLPCPRLKLGKPMDVAANIAKYCLENPIPHISNVGTSGPFINFKIDSKWYTYQIFNHILSNAQFGSNSSGNNKTRIVEFSSPNIAKPFHAGHMRGTIIGNILGNILKLNGYKVIKMNYLGDWGKQYGLLAVGYNLLGNEQDLLADPIKHLFDVYVEINKKAKDDEVIHEQARQYFRKMEDGDVDALALWSRFRDLSINMYKTVYKRLNVEFDVFSGESFYKETSLQQVHDLINDHQLLQHDDGADVIDMTDKKLGVVVFKKRDGTTTYISRDVAAAIDRYKTFKFDKMYYVIGSQQELHMRQLFQILKDLKLPFAGDCEHIQFGLIQGMSTRNGDVVFLKDILDAVQQETLQVMRNNESKFKDIDDPTAVADFVGLSAILIQDLQARRILGYTFNWDRMLSFEGSTGPYLQFTHARLCSLMRHFNYTVAGEVKEMDFTTLDAGVIDLAKHLIKYPDVIKRLATNFEPVGLVRYVMELAQLVASLLSKLIVRNATEEEQEKMLVAFGCAKIVLNKGMTVIGLTPVERM